MYLWWFYPDPVQYPKLSLFERNQLPDQLDLFLVVYGRINRKAL